MEAFWDENNLNPPLYPLFPLNEKLIELIYEKTKGNPRDSIKLCRRFIDMIVNEEMTVEQLMEAGTEIVATTKPVRVQEREEEERRRREIIKKIEDEKRKINSILGELGEAKAPEFTVVTGQEEETLEKVVQARAKAISAQNFDERMKAEGELSGFLGRLLAVMENYPELKASQNVSTLLEELTSTENRIAYARQFYNDTVMKYNTALEKFPTNIIASIFKFQPFPFFETASPEEREAPKVDLNF